MTKKLSSRQDILDVWVCRGAVYKGTKVDLVKATELSEVSNMFYVLNDLYSGKVNIYEILYSPESNFFPIITREIISKVCSSVSLDMDTDLVNAVKRACVTAPDPLQYLLDNLNDQMSLSDN